MAIRAVDFDFVEERKGDIVVGGTKLFDLFVCAGLLAGELIARKAKDLKAFVFVFFEDGFQGFVLRRQAAFGGDIDNEENFAFVGAQGSLFAINVFDVDIVDRIGEKRDRGHDKKGTDSCY